MLIIHSLRVRLVLLLVGTVFFTTLLAGLGGGWVLKYETSERFADDLRHEATEILTRSGGLDAAFFADTHEYHLRILDKKGVVIRQTSGFAGVPAELFANDFRRYVMADGQALRVFAARLPDGGTLQIAGHESSMFAFLDDGAWVMAWVVGLATLVAVGVGAWWAGIILRPIRAMTTAANAASLDGGTTWQAVDGRAGNELAELSRTLGNMLSRLKNSAERLRRFTADASHELRTPLTALRLAADVALRHAEPAEHKAALQFIKTELVTLSQLTERLLLLARADGDALPLQKQNCAFHQLISEVMMSLVPIATAQKVTLATDLQTTFVKADVQLLVQVVANLIQNAIQYSPVGGQVVVTLRRTKRRAILSIRDSGPGIAVADLPHIFERFYRADAARSGTGAGLGLAIAREIVIAHGGALRVQSKVGRGAIFTLTLPC